MSDGDRSAESDAPWDDDRPGLMRVHIAQQRGQALADRLTIQTLRQIATAEGVDLRWAGGRKADIATEIVIARNARGAA